MKDKRNVLYSLIIMLVGVIYLPVQAQQKNGTQGATFSGEWKSKESISIGGTVGCLYDPSDRMRSKTVKIAEQTDFLTIEVPNPSPEAALATSKEKLTFDGNVSEINHGRWRGKKYSAKLSADGQTMTVNSVVHLILLNATVAYSPFIRPESDPQRQLVVNVTEVWKLSNDGKSISVQTNTKSTSGDDRSWKTVFYKAS
jgi:hypothetical protein